MKRTWVWALASISLFLSACGPSGASIGGGGADFLSSEGALTRPLESGVPRRTRGEAGKAWLYTFDVASGFTSLDVGLNGEGSATLTVHDSDPTVGNVQPLCFGEGPGMWQRCHLVAPHEGRWYVLVVGRDVFSGQVQATLLVDRSDGGAPQTNRPHGLEVSKHTLLGLPDIPGVGDPQRWLLVKPQYVVSFNTTTKTPNWVSWEASAQWLGSAERTSSFRPDPDLPAIEPQARDSDFSGTPYARGHMCPSKDRSDNAQDNESTFVFTNVVPQLPELNNGPWKGLENEVRQLAAAGKHVLVMAGPIGGDGTSIGTGVDVPKATWKVLVVTDRQLALPEDLSTADRVVAVVMPNVTTVKGAWTQFRTTVRDIEAQTGLDLLADVPLAVQDVLENRVDTQVEK